jgi:hypothetical protein
MLASSWRVHDKKTPASLLHTSKALNLRNKLNACFLHEGGRKKRCFILSQPITLCAFVRVCSAKLESEMDGIVAGHSLYKNMVHDTWFGPPCLDARTICIHIKQSVCNAEHGRDSLPRIAAHA